MKWIAAVVGLTLYLVWPYYTLVEFAQAIQAGDAPAINGMVDWSSLRTNVKAQFHEKLETMPAPEGGNRAFAAFGNKLALTLADTLVDKLLTPQGLAALIQRGRAASPAKTARAESPASSLSAPRKSLYQMVEFAFFVTPVHFRLDLSDPEGGAGGLTVMMTFKGTGWQITNVRLPDINRSLKVAQVPARSP